MPQENNCFCFPCVQTCSVNIKYVLISSSCRQFKYLLYKEVFHIMAIFSINSFTKCEMNNCCGSDIILGSKQNIKIPMIRDAINTQRENLC